MRMTHLLSGCSQQDRATFVRQITGFDPDFRLTVTVIISNA